MTTKERLRQLVDELTEAEADETLQIVVARRQSGNDVDNEPADASPTRQVSHEHRLGHCGHRVARDIAAAEPPPVVPGRER